MRLLKRSIDTSEEELRDVKAGRVALACDHCRRRKVRCDAGKPSCRNCLKLGDACSYSPTPRQTSAVSQFAALNLRIQHLEELLEELVASGARAAAAATPTKDSTASRASSPPVAPDDAPLGKESSDSYRVPSFNDRLEQLKKHVTGGGGDCLYYKVGTSTLLLDRSDIDSISARLHDPDMFQRIVRLTQNVWRSNQLVTSRFLGVDAGFASPPAALPGADIGEPNKEFLEYVLDFYGMTNGRVPNVFLTMAEFRDQSLWDHEPDFVRSAGAAVVVLTTCVALRSRGIDGVPFTLEVIDSERHKAIQNVISALNMLQYCKPSFLLVRICTLGVYLLTVFSTVPSLHAFLAPLCEMARGLGLGKYHVNAAYPLAVARRRELVWCMLVSYQHTMATVLSEKAWLSGKSAEIGKSHLDTSTLIEFYYRNNDLGLIYDKVRTRLFNLSRRSDAGHDVYTEIISLDRELTNWVQGRVPSNFIHDTEFGRVDPEDVNSWLRELARSAMRHRYYLIRIAIHSIPAFYPEFLPKPIPGSVEKVAESASKLLELSRDGRMFRGAVTAVFSMTLTSAVAVLFYKHLKYPDHETNHQELMLLRQVLPQFKLNQWPEDEVGHPPSQVWEAMLDIMERQFQTSHPAPPLQPLNFPANVAAEAPVAPPKRKPRARKRKKTDQPSQPSQTSQPSQPPPHADQLQQPSAPQQLSPVDDPNASAALASQALRQGPMPRQGPIPISVPLGPSPLQVPSPASSQLLDSTFAQAQPMQFFRPPKLKQDIDGNGLDDDVLADSLFSKDDNCVVM